MTIIEISTTNGIHTIEAQSGRTECWMDGYITVPESLESKVWESMGYCDLVIEDGILTDIILLEIPVNLDEEKDKRITDSKTALADYLESHPLQWTDGQYYSITFDKQQQLSGKMSAAQAAQILGQPYVMEWNDTGMVCREWDIKDIAALGLAIDARVTSLVKYQQTKEIEMKAATTLEGLNAIEVDYDSVPLP